MLLCHSHCDVDFYPLSKIDRERLLSMTNDTIKFEKTGPNQTLVIDWTRLYMTDQQLQSNIPLLWRRA